MSEDRTRVRPAEVLIFYHDYKDKLGNTFNGELEGWVVTHDGKAIAAFNSLPAAQDWANSNAVQMDRGKIS